jgi:hypothetical protein
MGAKSQVFVDLSFQGRLRKSAEIVGAEIFFFTEMLEEHGTLVLDVPGYCLRVPINSTTTAKPNRIPILLKVVGVWTALWLEMRQPDVFVLYDADG